jgi:adenosylhomocysteine nucleosidase
VIVVVGLAFEARIVAGAGLSVICSGDGRRLPAVLSSAIMSARASTEGCRGLISFGVAGGLAPELETGACVVASEILSDAGNWTTDPIWSKELLSSLPDAVHGTIFGARAPVARPEAKRALHAKTGAVAVDMESQMVARIAAQFDLPMAALRVVTDPAGRTLPDWAFKAVRSNGTTDMMGMARLVLNRPSEVIGMVRTARDAWVARSVLLRGRQALSSAFNADRYLSPSALAIPEA